MTGEAGGGATPDEGLFPIGQFSRITGLTIKTIRLYGERGLLTPSRVDPDSGYRYFSEADVEQARLIVGLRSLDFPLAEIAELIAHREDEMRVIAFLESQRERIAARLSGLTRVSRELDRLIQAERAMAARETAGAPGKVVRKDLDAVLVAGLRWKGAYRDSGVALGRVCRAFGRHAVGAPFNLYYDGEYREEDAEIESCVPLRRERPVEGFDVRWLPAARVLSLVHEGPYSELSRSYARLFREVQEQGGEIGLPIREIYLKGPGLLFRGRPERYRTELQVPIAG